MRHIAISVRLAGLLLVAASGSVDNANTFTRARRTSTDGHRFVDRAELRNAVDLWINDEAGARSTYGDIGLWDTSRVTDMRDLFDRKSTFNADISQWDTSEVTSMAATRVPDGTPDREAIADKRPLPVLARMSR